MNLKNIHHMILPLIGIALLGAVVLTAAETPDSDSSATPKKTLDKSKPAETQPAEKKEDEEDKKPMTLEEFSALAETMRSSLVKVEFTLKYDRKGQSPYGGGYIPPRGFIGYLGELVKEERPLEIPGFVLSKTKILCPDPVIHPRFLAGIHARFGKQRIKAKIVRYFDTQYAVLLELDKPLTDVKPLDFQKAASRKSPYLMVRYQRRDAAWQVSMRAVGANVTVSTTGRKYLALPGFGLLVDKKGGAVGMSFNGELPVDDSWKTSPEDWKGISSKQRDEKLAAIEKTLGEGMFRVTLSFRSPKKKGGGSSRGADSITEKRTIGLLVDSQTLLIPTTLAPKLTARLDRIQAHTPSGIVEATFAGTLKDYGCLLAKFAKPMKGALKLADNNVQQYVNRLLGGVEVSLRGDELDTYFNHLHVAGYNLGWRRQTYMEILGVEERTYVFAPDGSLLALPLARREKVSTAGRGGRGDSLLTPAGYLKDILAAPKEHLDASNVPLKETEENRLAWLGVVLQPLDAELARFNKVSALTGNGSSGALVSYVYPESPAGKAKIKIGDILLRLHIEEEPKPINIQSEGIGRGLFPLVWIKYDFIPDRALEGVARPWPATETRLTRKLSDAGFGKKFTIEMFSAGKVQKKNFIVTESPPHYDSAKQSKHEAMGLTVRNLTYEVRRFFRLADTDPGVIISKVEPGAKASVAKLERYMIITHINDVPIRNLDDFEKITTGKLLKLSLKRWTRGLVVNLQLPETPTEKK